MKSRPIQLAAFVVLLSMSAIGFTLLTDYSTRPGGSGKVPQHLSVAEFSDVSWSGNLSSDNKPALLIFYHPKCPCTTATVRVLERLLPRSESPPAITAIAYCPENENEEWIDSRTTKALSSLDHSHVVIDRGGKLSARFGAIVSGHLLLYNADNQLTFSGGITPYRGHEGDSPSSLDLLNRINSPQSDCRTWPVFGCSIAEQAESP